MSVKKVHVSKPKGYITLTLRIYPEGKRYVSHCEELGTASCGDTEEEALKNIREAVESHLDALIELNDLERFFKERGIRVHRAVTNQKLPPVDVRFNETVSRQRHAVYV